MLGHDVAFFVPRWGTLYVGTLDDLDSFAFQFRPDDVLRQILRPETGLLLRRWRPGEPGPGDPQNAVIYEENVPFGAPRQRVTLDRRTGMLLVVAQLDGQNRPLWTRSFGDYRRIDRGSGGRRGRAGEDARWYPFHMAVSWPREGRMIELRFRRVEADAPLFESDFDLAVPGNVRQHPIRDATFDFPEGQD
jgi:hypothetical protein